DRADLEREGLKLVDGAALRAILCGRGLPSLSRVSALRTVLERNRHSSDGVKKSIGKVKQPRHFLLNRTLTVGPVEIGRVLHGSMGRKRHLPEEYRAGPEEPEARD